MCRFKDVNAARTYRLVSFNELGAHVCDVRSPHVYLYPHDRVPLCGRQGNVERSQRVAHFIIVDIEFIALGIVDHDCHNFMTPLERCLIETQSGQ